MGLVAEATTLRIGVFLVSLLLGGVIARADVAPVIYYGRTPAPVANSDIRMESENVEIFIGEPVADSVFVRKARVKASFSMLNESNDTCRVLVGFPIFDLMYNISPHDELGIFDFSVIINNADTVIPVMSHVVGDYTTRNEKEHMWYGWDMVFPPGRTSIDVEYGLRTSHTKSRCYQNLGYIMYTGSYWKGPIDHAEITVRLPERVDSEWLVGPRTTPGYQINLREIVWVFEDFEPSRTDDIRVEFMPPELDASIKQLESRLSVDSLNANALVALARLYLKAARTSGAEPSGSGYPDFAGKAEPLLKRAVALDPSNTLAWNTYLTSYFRIHDAAFGLGWHERFPLLEEQAALIRTAYKHCPDDPGVSLWHQLITQSEWELPETLGRLDSQQTSRLSIRIPHYYEGHGSPVFTDDEMAVIREFYDEKEYQTDRGPSGGWLVRNDKPLSTESEARLKTILSRMFVRWITDQIRVHNRRAGV